MRVPGTDGGILPLRLLEKLEEVMAKKYKEVVAAKGLKDLKDVMDIQLSNGNWNYDEYMLGLANGLILARHLIRGLSGECKYKKQPKVWLKDLAAKTKPVIYGSK